MKLGIYDYPHDFIDKAVIYWNHPEHATRISFRLGALALIISLISLIISFIAIV